MKKLRVADVIADFLVDRGVDTVFGLMGGGAMFLNDALAVRAKEITAKQTKLLMNGRLGMVIDGTGGDYKIIKEQVEELRNIGYDTYMIFVNTSLETALARNKARDRTIPENIVTNTAKQMLENEKKIHGLYEKYLFRKADPEGLFYFQRHLLGGKSFEWLENELKTSEEAKRMLSY